jgi:hypothetical protein
MTHALLSGVSHSTLLVALRGVPLRNGLAFTTNITRGTNDLPSHPIIDPRHDWTWE